MTTTYAVQHPDMSHALIMEAHPNHTERFLVNMAMMHMLREFDVALSRDEFIVEVVADDTVSINLFQEETTMTTTKYQKYIDACREAGLTNDSLFYEIEEAVFDAMEVAGFGYGQGYTADAQDREEAWGKAHDIAKAIDGLL